MATFYDLPPEILQIIFQALPPLALLSICRVSRLFHAASFPFLVSSFRGDCRSGLIWERLKSFLQIITKVDAGQHVKSVLLDRIDTIDNSGLGTLRLFMSQLLPQVSNIQLLAIPGDPEFLSLLRGFSLRHLQELHCVYSGPEIWEIIHLFPRLSRLSLENHLCDAVQLPASSLPIENVLLDTCDLDTQSLCAIIRSCRRLVSFKYLRPLFYPVLRIPLPLDAQAIHEALSPHRETLEELFVEDHNHRIAYDKTPKFGSFRDFPALQRLGVECNALTVQRPLPPSLRSIAIRHCDSFEAADVVLCIGRLPSVEAIQFDDKDGGLAIVFQRFQTLGRIRKDIRVEIAGLFAYSDRPTMGYGDYPLHYV